MGVTAEMLRRAGVSEAEYRLAMESVSHLGQGGSGPWEDRTYVVREQQRAGTAGPFTARVVAGHLNATYSVQRAQHPEHPGIDHLLVRRHDGEPVRSWPDLQRIKDRLAPDGQLRFAIEVYPPRLLVVDNCNLYHLWVMPKGWDPGFGIHDAQPGFVQC